MDPFALELHDLEVNYYDRQGHRKIQTIRVIAPVYEKYKSTQRVMRDILTVSHVEEEDLERRKSYPDHAFMTMITFRVNEPINFDSHIRDRHFFVPEETYKKFCDHRARTHNHAVVNNAFIDEVLDHAMKEIQKHTQPNEEVETPSRPDEPAYDNLQLAKDIF